MVIFANSKADLTRKFTDILRSLRNHRLNVKPDSLEWTCTVNHHFGDRGKIDIDHAMGPVQFTFKPKGLNILGVWLDPSNNNESIWRHRLIEAQLAWLGLKKQSCRRGTAERPGSKMASHGGEDFTVGVRRLDHDKG